MRSSFNSNIPQVLNYYRQKKRTGIYRLGQLVLKGAGNRTPAKSRKLRQMTNVKQVSDNRSEVHWSARHAAVQNIGKRRGARPFSKYTTGGTGAGFVQVGIDYARKRVKEAFQ